ncbi:MAG TPA: xanthine dehydrogenase family protein molybdopterin-binding subunit [Anaerolineales bacterium]|nr:xanthine dehydrogenase family protein molybdopterin-binding subunit [Anaerolineales bacterium]
MGYVGESVKRVEDPRFIQGQGKYVANLQLPGMVYAAIKRSPYAHAEIKSINTEAASKLAGVVAVYTGRDMVEGTRFSGPCGALPCGWVPPDTKVPTHHPLAVDKVNCVGEGVAVVVAESAYIAYDALDLITVDYEPLPAVVDAKAAAQEGATQLYDEIANNISFHWPLGNKEATDKAFSEADHVVELNLINQRLIPNAIEPRAVAAQWNGFGEEMTVWTTSQNPHIIRLLLSGFTLGVPENKLRVVSPDVGGGFGSKIFHYPEEVIVPWVARAVDRPVKWVSSRSEAYMTDAHGRDHVTSCKLALKKDGTITGLHVTTWANMGAYLSTFAPLIPTALYITLFSGLYKIPAIWGEVWGVLTNTVPVDAYRGAGRPEASYLLERLVDLAASELNMDVIEIRRKNFIPENEFPYQTPVAMVYDSGNYAKLFDKAVELGGYEDMRKDQNAARREGRLVGVGVSGCIEASGPGPSPVVTSLGAAIGLYETGIVRVHPTGNVSVFTGSHAHGQGHETTFAQVVADELGLPMEAVQIVHGDTDRIPFGAGTYGSRSIAVGGSALVRSAEKIREKVTRIAAHQLEAAYEDMVYDRETGTIYVKGSPDKSKTFAEIAFTTYYANNIPQGMEPGLEAMTYYDPSNFTFPNSAHIAQVEIDRDTGAVTITRYVAVDDVGKVINPMIVNGQIVGGIAQGVGQALWENGLYDENGQLLSGSMMNYALPRADQFPKMETGRIETPSPHNPLGVKGAGEMGTIAATVTIANAVMDALAPLGIRHIDMPLTAEKIWQAMQSSQNGGAN